jgi:AcrR family transcriptional regulator
MATAEARTLTARGEARRKAILEAAERVFAERGYDGASISEIAGRASTAKSVIYDHFPSKAALHKAAVEARGQELQAHVATAVAEKAGEPARERLRAGVDAYFSYVESHPAAWNLLVRDAPADPELVEYHADLQRRAREAVAELFTANVGDPDLRLHKEMSAEALRTAISGLARWWYDHPKVPRERLVEAIMRLDWFGHGPTRP